MKISVQCKQDATCFDADSEEKADVLIADLPCSGLGVLAKKTDLKYKMNPETETEVAKHFRERSWMRFADM